MAVSTKTALHGLAKATSRMSHEELRDRFLDLHNHNNDLKKEVAAAQEKIKILTTKNHSYKARLAKAENSQSVNGARAKPVSSSARLERAEERIAELEKLNAQLKRKLEKYKHGTESTISSSKPSPYHHVRSKVASSKRGQPLGVRKETSISMQQDLLQRTEVEAEGLRNDVAGLENQMALMQDQLNGHAVENRDLRQALSETQNQYREFQLHVQGTQQQLTTQLKQKDLDKNIGTMQLKRALKEKESGLQALQVKYDVIYEQNESLSRQLADATKDLQSKHLETVAMQSRLHAFTIDHQTDSLSVRSQTEQSLRIEQLERECKLLSETNQKMANAALDGELGRKHQRQVEVLQQKISVLEKQLRAAMSTQSELHGQLAHEHQKHSDTQEDNRKLRREFLQLQVSHDKLSRQMQFFSSESTIDMEEIEEALTIVKERRDKKDEHMDFEFLKPLQESEADIKRELQHLSVAHAETVHELEKVRKLLRMQKEIAREHEDSKEDLQKRLNIQTREYAAKLDEHQKMLDRKSTKIKKLQEQIKDIAYGTHQYVVLPQDSESAAPSNNDAFDEVELQLGENLVELCIADVVFSNEAIATFEKTPDIKTFVTYDFFDHPSETTPVQEGLRPLFNSSSRHKVKVSDDFLHYLQSGSMQVELHQAMGTSYELLASGTTKFETVVQEGNLGANRKLTGSIMLRDSKQPDIVFADVHFWMRFRLPLDHAVRDLNARSKAMSYDQSNIQETQQGSPKKASGSPGNGAQANVLQIKITSCNNLVPRRLNTQPSAYVAYQFYQFYPEHCTATIPASNNPRVNDLQRFAVDMSDDLDQYLRTSSLELFVVDDADPHLDAFLGQLQLPLVLLSLNQPVVGAFNILSDLQTISGTVHLEMRWENPYRVREPYPDTTSFDNLKKASILPSTPTTRSPGTQEQTGVTENIPTKSNQVEVESAILGSIEDTDLRDDPTLRNKSATVIQRAYRDHSQRKQQRKLNALRQLEMEKQHAAATKIQSTFRGHRIRQAALLTRESKAHQPEQQSMVSVSADTAPLSITETPTPIPTSLNPPKPMRVIPEAKVIIHRLKFNGNSHIMTSKDVKNLFVSYSFLGVPSDLLETPDSKPKPVSSDNFVNFDHQIVFRFDGAPDVDMDGNLIDNRIMGGSRLPKALKALAKKFATNKSFLMNFDVVHEPDEDADPSQTCEAVGFAQIELYNIWRTGKDYVRFAAKLYDYYAWNTAAEQELVEVGIMEFSIVLVESIKALTKKK